MAANDRQPGGEHYKKHGATGEQHWDRIARLFGPASYVYFVAAATKYLERYRDKNGIQDLEKAIHYIEKLIELEKQWSQQNTKKPVAEPKRTKRSSSKGS